MTLSFHSHLKTTVSWLCSNLANQPITALKVWASTKGTPCVVTDVFGSCARRPSFFSDSSGTHYEHFIETL